MGMVVEEDQSLEGLTEHLWGHLAKLVSDLISNFYGQYQKAQETETPLLMICSCWPEK